MKNNGRAEIVKCGSKLVPYKKGYSLATVYRMNPKTVSTYELLNFGYCPSTKNFYYNKNINLPEDIVERIETMPISKETEEFLSSIGLHSYDDVEMLLEQYERAIKDVSFTRHKVLRTFGKGNK